MTDKTTDKIADKPKKLGAFASMAEVDREIAKAAYRASDAAKSDSPPTIDEWLATADGKKAIK